MMSRAEDRPSAVWGTRDAAQFHDPAATKLLDAVAQLTAALFPGSVSMTEEFDPAEPADRYVVFTATAKGDWKEIRDSVLAWHEQVRALCPEPVNYFRLDVHPQ